MKRIAIIGGGIAGLAAAFYLQRARGQGASLEYVLFEGGSRLGGVLQTEEVEGFLLEAGPDSFLTAKPWAAQLARDAGLGGQLIASLDQARKVHIVVHGKLLPLPEGLQFMVPSKMLPALMSPLFSWATRAHIVQEALGRFPRQKASGDKSASGDESAASFVARHFGGEMVERVAGPLLAGVYGGDAARLSARAVLPSFIEMEARNGSLIRGVRARGKASAKPGGAGGIFTSFQKGMQQFVDAVATGIDPQSIRLHAEISGLMHNSSGWQVTPADPANAWDGQPFDSVVLAVPAYAAASLVEHLNLPLAAALRKIPYSSSVLALLAYDQEAARQLPPGFGFLVPRGEGRRILACTMIHNKFAGRVPPSAALLRVFMGGVGDEEVLSLGDDEIQAIAQTELREILGLRASPKFSRIYRWPRAMAQYEVGHLERVNEIETAAGETPGLFLAGNAYRGIGIPDCVLSGARAAAKIIG